MPARFVGLPDLCPCSTRTLIQAVTRALKGLVTNDEDLSETVEDTLEALVAHGDLLECHDVIRDDVQKVGALIYTAPPSFIRRKSGAVLLLGIIPDHISLLPEDMEKCIEHVNHVRRFPPNTVNDVRSYLSQLGFVELSPDAWLKTPPNETAAQHLTKLGRLLDTASPSGDVPGLSYSIHPVRSVTTVGVGSSQPDRAGALSGDAPKHTVLTYGATSRLKKGLPTKFIDLPLASSTFRGCDEAWQLQAAIDFQRHESQWFQVDPGPNSTYVVNFFSPVPMWAKASRWDSIGEPVVSGGCLFSYRFSPGETEEELRFAQEKLWLAEVSENRTM